MNKSIIIPDNVLKSMKDSKPKIYQQMVDFNARIKPYYDKYSDDVIFDAWRNSEPDKDTATNMTLDERFQLFDAKLQEV